MQKFAIRLLEWSDQIRQGLGRRRLAPHLIAGQRGEDLAQRYLQRQGFTILARNWRLDGHDFEIDLVALEGETHVFIEVKTRARDDDGAPERAIDDVKLKNLRAGAQAFLRKRLPRPPWRLDLITVVLEPEPALEHYRDAFSRRAVQVR